MKKLIFILGIIMCAQAAKSQTLNPFPTTDSLRKFINKWVRNSPIDAFTNLRLNSILIAMTRFIDSTIAAGAAVDGFASINDSTTRLTTNNLDTFYASIPATRWGRNHTLQVLQPSPFSSIKITQPGVTSNGFSTWPSITTYSKGVLGAYGIEPSIDVLIDSTSQFQIGALTFRSNKLASGGVADKFPRLPSSRHGAGAYAQIEANAFRNGSAPWTSTIELYLGDSTGNNTNVTFAASGPGSHFFGSRRYFTAEAKEAIYFGTAINRVNNGSFGNLNSFFAGNLNSLPAYLFNMPSVAPDSTNNKAIVYNPSTSAINYMNWPTAGGGSPAGSNTQIQYNNSGSFGASANFTYDGTTVKQNNATAAHSIASTTALGSGSGGDIRLFASATPTGANNRLGGFMVGTLDGGSTENVTGGLQWYSTAAHTPGSSEQTYATLSTTATNALSVVQYWTANLRTGIRVSNPLAALHLPAGNSSAGGAPLAFTVSGTSLLTTPAQGMMEPDANGRLFWSQASGAGARRQTVYTDSVGAVPNGRLAIGNGTDYTSATLTAGKNTTITNGSGSITIAAGKFGINTYTSNTSASSGDIPKYVFLSGASGTVNYQINPASFTDETFAIKCIDATNTVKITLSSGTIDGLSELQLVLNQTVWVTSNGTNLYIVNQ